jgi:hypothetical protein
MNHAAANRLREAVRCGERITGPPWALSSRRARLAPYVFLVAYVGRERAEGRINAGPLVQARNGVDLSYRLAELLQRKDPALLYRLEHGHLPLERCADPIRTWGKPAPVKKDK